MGSPFKPNNCRIVVQDREAKVTVEVEEGSITLREFLDRLIKPALEALGYSPALVEKIHILE